MLPNLPERDLQLKTFINQCFEVGETTVTKIEGDAGLRNYFRLTNSGNSYILMDCPNWYCSVEPFIKMANHFRQHNISTPKILQQNVQDGFLLLEDFGNLNIKNFLRSLPSSALLKETYYLIIDFLLLIQNTPSHPTLIHYTNDLMLEELELFTSWYVPYKSGKELNETQIHNFKEVWRQVLKKQNSMDSTIVHRDYHVENMMYLSKQEGVNIFGILDFQDALFGSPIYDLVSVLEDARVRVSRDLALSCIEYFSARKNLDYNSVLLNYHILGAQRNSRILGIFARKALRDKANQYLQYIPLVLEYLKYDLMHPELVELKTMYQEYIT